MIVCINPVARRPSRKHRRRATYARSLARQYEAVMTRAAMRIRPSSRVCATLRADFAWSAGSAYLEYDEESEIGLWAGDHRSGAGVS